MNTDVKILNKILSNINQQYIIKKFFQGFIGFIPGMQNWFSIFKNQLTHHTNRLKKKNHNHIKEGKNMTKFNSH